jgi:hypothetical protein
MRRSIVRLVSFAVLVLVPPAAASVSASISPTAVDFGRVPFDVGCFVAGDVPNERCVTRTVTITNTGTESLEGVGLRSCETYVAASNICFTIHAGWGGFATGGDPRTCIFAAVAPGESCTVLLVAVPSRRGRIAGSFVAEMYSAVSDLTTVLVVPVKLLAVPGRAR